LCRCAANVAVDLEAFAAHAGRTTIKTDDVMLLTRRNEGLESIMMDFTQKLREKNDRERGRKTKA
jgi:centromere protein S